MNIGDLQKLIGAIVLDNPGDVEKIKLSPFDLYDTSEDIKSQFKNIGIELIPDVTVPPGIVIVVHSDTSPA